MTASWRQPGEQLRRNLVSGIGATLIGAALTLVSYPVYIRFLGLPMFGLWTVLTTIATFTSVSMIGIGPALSKHVAEAYARGDQEQVRSYVSTAFLGTGLLAALASVASLLLKRQIVGVFGLEPRYAEIAEASFPFVCLLSMTVLLAEVVGATFSGLGRMDLTNGLNLLTQMLTVAVSTALLWSGFGLGALIAGAAGVGLAVQVAAHTVLLRSFGICAVSARHWSPTAARAIAAFGSRLIGGSLLDMLILPVNKILLSRECGTAAVSIYEIAFFSAMRARSVIDAGMRALMPDVSRVSAGRGGGWVRPLAERNARYGRTILLLGVPSAVALASGAGWLFQLWLGRAFDASLVQAFRIVLAGSFACVLGSPSYYTLMGLGRVGDLLAGKAVQSAANLAVLAAVLISGIRLQVSLVCLATSAAMIAATGYQYWRYRCALRSIGPSRDRAESIDEDCPVYG